MKNADPQVAAASAEFKSQPLNRESAAVRLAPQIKTGMTGAAVEQLLGPPGEQVWVYALFYSSIATISFKAQAGVVRISSDMLPRDKDAASRWDLKDPQIQAAMVEFKSKPYARQKAAAKLLPGIRLAMSPPDVEAILGTPTEIVWDYSLRTGSPALLRVRLDAANQVTEAALTGLPGKH